MYFPFKVNFDNARKLEHISNFCLYGFSIILLLIYFNTDKVLIHNLSLVSSGLVIFYYIFLVFHKYIMFRANMLRRTDFIDNSFGTFLGEKKSKKYYSNDGIDIGFLKAAINSFESLFFTLNIGKKMILSLFFKTIIVFCLIILFLLKEVNNIEVIVFIIHLSLPFIVISDFIRHLFFLINLSEVYKNYGIIFTNLSQGVSIDQKKPEMLNNIVLYESLIFWGNILLSQKIYDKENVRLSKEWEQIKLDYNIG